ncbi:MAG: hypothetical protein IIW81_05150 [Oscillospiraceae bacterium]|nr:hypothetical protein [Oscillospiraceae bacterium]
MNIGLIDVDGHNFPNLALMKLSAYYKERGDFVEMYQGLHNDPEFMYDKVYMSKVFDETYSEDEFEPCNTFEIIKGGTGYDLENKLPEEIEHIMPDYSLYGISDTAYGFLSRGCPRGCPFCIVAEKEGRCSKKVADLSEWWNGQKNIELLDPNITACKDYFDLMAQLRDSKAVVNINQGIDCRLLTEEKILALNEVKIKCVHFAWDLMKESDKVLEGLELYRKFGKLKERQRKVYVLCNFDTTMDENLERIYTLKKMQFDPYVMIYDKPNAPKELLKLQRWVNNKFVFRKCERFEDYKR